MTYQSDQSETEIYLYVYDMSKGVKQAMKQLIYLVVCIIIIFLSGLAKTFSAMIIGIFHYLE